jgi:2-polyprenyl-6-methoxyphenol hydroxylase-like FAD-dependent oxidoreductase
MKNNPQQHDVVVIGAGLGGLAAARLVAARGGKVVVLAAHTPGGRAASTESNGFTFNRGPRALYEGGPAERVLSRLGVTMTGAAPGQILGRWGDEVDVLPATPMQLMRSRRLSLRSKVQLGRVFGRLERMNIAALSTMTFAEWLDDVATQQDLHSLLNMLGRLSSYADMPHEVSADVVVGSIAAAVNGGVRYLDGGWQTLVDQLAVGVPMVHAEVAKVQGDADGVEVLTTDGVVRHARAAVIAAGGPDVAARLLGREPFPAGPAVQVACYDLGVRMAAPPRGLMGIDLPLYLSTHCPPARLAAPGHQVVHAMRYLGRDPQTWLPADAQRAELMAHAALVGVREESMVESRYFHRMVSCTSIATARLGGLRGRPRAANSGSDNVFLAGDWVGPEGHLLDAVLASADAAARLACAKLPS